MEGEVWAGPEMLSPAISYMTETEKRRVFCGLRRLKLNGLGGLDSGPAHKSQSEPWREARILHQIVVRVADRGALARSGW